MPLLDSFGGRDAKAKSLPEWTSNRSLRKEVDELLLKRRTDIEAQLGMLASVSGERGTRVYPNRCPFPSLVLRTTV
jgi:hypothetical protein